MSSSIRTERELAGSPPSSQEILYGDVGEGFVVVGVATAATISDSRQAFPKVNESRDIAAPFCS